MLFQKAAFLSLWAVGLARTVPPPKLQLQVRQNPTATAGASAAQSTMCGNIVDAVDQGYVDFWAFEAYECLTSVPFNPAVASRFLKYWNETVQFQSTLAYLKNPPTGYQQPAVDVLQELTKIQQRIDSGFYTNQYAFEADFNLLTYAMHDGHVRLVAGTLAAFTFLAPFEIASVSVDGISLPKIYFTQDILDAQTENWTPSPIKTINGEDATEFLTKFAALNSWGYLEPHAEWNALMSSPVVDIQAGGTIWSAGATFYPGDNLTIHFENYTTGDDSTVWETIWIATYNEIANYTGPLTTGGDFYNYFVLGNLPASFNESAIIVPPIPTQSAAAGNWSEASYNAFPEDPDVVQYDLDLYHTGLVSGYFLHDISTGVLSLPSFDVLSETIGNYSGAVTHFIEQASAEGLDNIIIDLQRNTGGVTLLAFTTFKSLFPDLLPFAGSRRRSFPMGNTIGSATTDFWELLDEDDEDEREFKYQLAADEWVITNRINAATGKNFTSWREYQEGPTDHNDKFTLVEQYDLANEVFDAAAFDEWYPTMYMPNKSAWPIQERLFNPGQVTILTDGICSSACSLLIEMMTRVGVKTVVAGGRPQTGPMQAAGGNRGAAIYTTVDLDSDIEVALNIDPFVEENTAAALPAVREPGMSIQYATINLRDQIRKGDTTPLQFKYEAADCRIYYTLANLYNTTRLWHDVAAASKDKSRCVEGSTGFSTTNNTTPSPPPKPQAERPILNLENRVVEQMEFDDKPNDGLRDTTSADIKTPYKCPTGTKVGQKCPDGKAICAMVPITCPGAEGKKNLPVCIPDCSCQASSCNCDGKCQIFDKVERKVSGRPQISIKTAATQGKCYPGVGTGNVRLGCRANPKISR
ncbi:hypothetical protein P280DRAFT_473346 [Massarina eburnea CBS 473.64]|uniref:CPAF-like PDZ domain-containing protein n=1 Tax=Massarina eburnea CBS 473.64 TaxID=1395130 RepID=A0A6A6RPU7_9PLEO|nr:hypothetical protein P280DRAFT_473346 [Massarina eburnea CBS 473.64]